MRLYYLFYFWKIIETFEKHMHTTGLRKLEDRAEQVDGVVQSAVNQNEAVERACDDQPRLVLLVQ